MGPVFRSALALALGIVVGSVLIGACDFAAAMVYPLPPGIDTNDREAMKTAMANAPPTALLLVLLGHAAGTFAGAWLAARLARRARIVHGMVIGVLFLLAGLGNVLMLPHPTWFTIADLAVFLPAAFAGSRLAVRGRPAAAQPVIVS